MSSRFSSPYPPINEDDCRQSLCTFLFDFGARYPADKTCYIDGITGEVVSREAHRRQALWLASAFRNLEAVGMESLEKGATVIVFSPNSLLFPALMFAFSAAAVKPAYVNSNYVESELAHAWKVTHATHLFVHPSVLPVAQNTLRSLGYSREDILKRIVLLANDTDLPPATRNEKWTGLDRLVPDHNLPLPERFDGADSDETAAFYFSSGTTGLNKAIALTHFNLCVNLMQMYSCWQWFNQTDVVLSVIPFFHIYGACNAVLLNYMMGLPFVILPKFTPQTFLAAIQNHKITALLLAPPLVNFLATSPLVDEYDLSSVRVFGVGAAPVVTSMLDRCYARFLKYGTRLEMAGAYGLTEITGLVSFLPTNRLKDKRGSIGQVLPNVQGRLVDESGNDVPAGLPGEIWLKSPAVMKGYFENPQADAETLTPDGWLQTGDIGVRDEDGFLWIVDRKKELIKYKGYQIAPMELEAILVEHPGVQDSAVIGVWSDEEGTELPRAYVVARKTDDQDRGALVSDIHKWLDGRVAHYKLLRGGIVVIESIPRSQAGKILRRQLRELAKAEAGVPKARI